MGGEFISGVEVSTTAVAGMVVGRGCEVGFVGGGCVVVGVAAVTKVIAFFGPDVRTQVLRCWEKLVTGDAV